MCVCVHVCVHVHAFGIYVMVLTLMQEMTPFLSTTSSALRERHQVLASSSSSPAVKRLHSTGVSSSPGPCGKERAPEDRVDLTCSLTLSPEKQQGKVLNEW